MAARLNRLAAERQGQKLLRAYEVATAILRKVAEVVSQPDQAFCAFLEKEEVYAYYIDLVPIWSGQARAAGAAPEPPLTLEQLGLSPNKLQVLATDIWSISHLYARIDGPAHKLYLCNSPMEPRGACLSWTDGFADKLICGCCRRAPATAAGEAGRTGVRGPPGAGGFRVSQEGLKKRAGRREAAAPPVTRPSNLSDEGAAALHSALAGLSLTGLPHASPESSDD